ncbi:MAG: polya polymerase [Oscillospiraceae bacterium]|nr:polya polymerase [Oscillospiraceae bacterium]
MKLTNVKDVEKFIQVIKECEHDVYLKSQEGDVFNLKSSLSQYIAIGRLVDENGDSLELFADSREDEARLIHFLCELDEEAKAVA